MSGTALESKDTGINKRDKTPHGVSILVEKSDNKQDK